MNVSYFTLPAINISEIRGDQPTKPAYRRTVAFSSEVAAGSRKRVKTKTCSLLPMQSEPIEF
jgi:hypothetical protein